MYTILWWTLCKSNNIIFYFIVPRYVGYKGIYHVNLTFYLNTVCINTVKKSYSIVDYRLKQNMKPYIVFKFMNREQLNVYKYAYIRCRYYIFTSTHYQMHYNIIISLSVSITLAYKRSDRI